MKRILIVGAGGAGQRYLSIMSKLREEGNCPPIRVDWIDPKYTNIEHSTIDEKNYDAYCITTPTDTHCKVLTHLIGYKKPILVEKTAVTSFEEFKQVVQACEKIGFSKEKIFVGYQLRFLDIIREIRKSLVRRDYGDIIRVTFKYGYDIAQWKNLKTKTSYPYRDGVLFEVSHELDLVRFLFPKAFFISGFQSVLPYAEGALPQVALLGYKVPRIGALLVDINYVQPRHERYIEIIGNHRTVKYEINIAEEMLSAYGALLNEFLSVLHGGAVENLATFGSTYHLLSDIHKVKLISD